MHSFKNSFTCLLIAFLNAFMNLFIHKYHLLKVFYVIGTTGSPGNLAVKNKDQRKKTSKKILADHDEYYDRNKAR